MGDLTYNMEALFEIDRDMAKEGWHLTLFRDNRGWLARYTNPEYLETAARAKTPWEAVLEAAKKTNLRGCK
jgi:dTDP-4-dehydrorhamnose 3,5-epimerase-like enzyme